ncbi:MAG: hypothetical protein C4560_08755 [Nitrospiraceae bacterium]|nr:MAG: hypothetical protein C4560_08755 [Nitrospiraceae bacterium]
MELDKEADEDKEIHLLDYFIVLAKRKKLILGITLSVALVTSIYAFSLPTIYWGRTTILLPQGGREPMWIRMIGEYAGGSSFSGPGIEPQLYTQLLYSGPVLDRIIDRFKLIEHYKNAVTKKDMHDMLKSSVTTDFVLPKNSTGVLGVQTSRILMISTKDKDPVKAADMANAFVEALQVFLKDIAVTQASRKRLFFEEQLKKVKEDLIKSEEAMREFQEKTGVVKVEAQAGAVIQGIANLRAEIAAREVELSVMKSYSTLNNPDLQRIAETIKGLKTELAKLEQKGGNSPDSLMTTGRMPSVGTDYVRKMRDLKFNETLYELMMKQYEAARIEEAGDPALIQVIEKAYPSKEKAGPERRKRVLTSTASSFLFSMVLAFILEFLEKQQSVSAESRERFKTLKRYLSFKRNR